MIDQDDYIRQLRTKLGMIQTERTAIDLVLDDSEMIDLYNLLQRIVTVGNKTVNNYVGLDQLKDQVKPSVDGATANYFHKKFFVQENQMNFGKVERQHQNQISMIRGNDPTAISSLGRFMKTTIAGKNFFDMSSQRKIFSHYIASSKELVVVDLENSNYPTKMQERRLESRDLKIDFRTSLIQRPDGVVFFTGGFDDLRRRAHNLVE